MQYLITREELEEIDRCARAYGWEIGQGQAIIPQLETTDGNPFMDHDWKEKNGFYNRPS